MGSLSVDPIRFATPTILKRHTTMPSFSYETSFTNEFSSSSSSSSSATGMSRASSVSSELDELLYQSFNMGEKARKGFSGNSTLRPEFQHLATIIQGSKFKAILKLLPCSQLLSWLFKVRLYHQTELNFKSSVGGRQLKTDSAPEGHVITTLLNVLVLIA